MNTERNIENPQPKKTSIFATIIYAVLLALAFIGLGMVWSY